MIYMLTDYRTYRWNLPAKCFFWFVSDKSVPLETKLHRILHSVLGAHGEVETWVSCDSDTPMWRYATLPVVIQIYRKFFFNNLSIFLNIKILLTAFRQKCPQMLFANFCANQSNGLWGVQNSGYEVLENARMWELLAKTRLPDYSATCWWTHVIFGVSATGTSLYHPYE